MCLLQKSTHFFRSGQEGRGPNEILKIIQNCEQIVRFSNVSCAVKQIIGINLHDNYWIFRFVSLKFVNDAQEKIKWGILIHHSP